MGFIAAGPGHKGHGERRVLAWPAARLALAIAAGILLVALLAGAVRALPLLLAPGVPIRVAAPVTRGILAVSLEIALFVAPPIAWALAASRLVDRGEARALAAIGVRPARIVATTWPAALLVAAAAGLAAAAWGREAAAPGRLLRDLLADSRAVCAPIAGAAPGSDQRPAAVEVPLLGVTWICLPGEAPRAVGPAPFGGEGAVFSATGMDVSDDLRSLHLRDLTLVVPKGEARPVELRMRIGATSVRGVAPLGRASNLTVIARTLLMGVSAVLMATAAALVVLVGSIRSRTAALALGVAGPGAALVVMSNLERGPASPALYLVMPLAGLCALVILGIAAKVWQGRAVARAT